VRLPLLQPRRNLIAEGAFLMEEGPRSMCPRVCRDSFQQLPTVGSRRLDQQGYAQTFHKTNDTRSLGWLCRWNMPDHVESLGKCPLLHDPGICAVASQMAQPSCLMAAGLPVVLTEITPSEGGSCLPCSGCVQCTSWWVCRVVDYGFATRLVGPSHEQLGRVGGLVRKWADVVEYFRVFRHVGFFCGLCENIATVGWK